MTGNDDPYVYPGTRILRNRFGIIDPGILDKVERRYVLQRSRRGVPSGSFDLAHLRAIHRHLFQDVYDWAGELRTVENRQGRGSIPVPPGMADVHRRLTRTAFLQRLPAREFAREAAVIIGDINYIHPFREGNGRTQAQYLQQLGGQAGHPLDFRRLDPKLWIDASRASHATDYSLMAEAIRRAITPSRRG